MIIRWYIINLFTLILFFVANKMFNIFNILLSSKWPCGIDEQKLLPPFSWGTKRIREVPKVTQVSQGWECWNQNPGLVTFRASLLPGFFWVLVAFDMSQWCWWFSCAIFFFFIMSFDYLPWGWYKVFVYGANELLSYKTMLQT